MIPTGGSTFVFIHISIYKALRRGGACIKPQGADILFGDQISISGSIPSTPASSTNTENRKVKVGLIFI